MEFLGNIDIAILSVALIANTVLSILVYLHNPKSATNLIFIVLGFTTSFVLLANYLSVNSAFSEHTLLYLTRITVTLAIPHSVLFFLLAYTIPSRIFLISKRVFFFIVFFSGLAMLLTFSPYVFQDVQKMDGFIQKNVGPAIVVFVAFVSLFSIAAVSVLIKRVLRARGIEKRQLSLVLSGIILSLGLVITTIVLPTMLFQNTTFVILTPVYFFVFLLATAYAIFKHQLFNIKVIATESLAYVLMAVTLFDALFARDLGTFVLKISIFILVLSFGILLIRSVRREVYLREQLQEANKAQESLIHFITHQVKGFLTKSRNIFAELAEGTFGPISEDVKQISDQGLKINTDAVTTVQTILNAANIKTGKITYENKPIDLKALVKEIFEKYKSNAEDKSLSYNLEIDENQEFKINGDVGKLTEAFSNLIDNSIKYTPKGNINVSLVKSDKSIKFKVKDTGVGILPADKAKLFTEGGRGSNAQKVNVDSTGFGLYIVKNIIKAHSGTIQAESEGENRGSEFVVELPIARV